MQPSLGQFTSNLRWPHCRGALTSFDRFFDADRQRPASGSRLPYKLCLFPNPDVIERAEISGKKRRRASMGIDDSSTHPQKC